MYSFLVLRSHIGICYTAIFFIFFLWPKWHLKIMEHSTSFSPLWPFALIILWYLAAPGFQNINLLVFNCNQFIFLLTLLFSTVTNSSSLLSQIKSTKRALCIILLIFSLLNSKAFLQSLSLSFTHYLMWLISIISSTNNIHKETPSWISAVELLMTNS